MECKGDGSCLTQMDDLQYQKGYENDCNHKCEPVNCPNYEICGNNYPVWLSRCHGGFCSDCSIMFGCIIEIVTLEEKDDCCICIEKTDRMAKFPSCSHHVCIACYKKHYFGVDEDIQESAENCPLCRKGIEYNKWWGK